jgi:predicted transcriptional regulator
MEMVGLGFFAFVLLVGVVSSLIAMSNTTWPSEEEGHFDLRPHRNELRSVDRKSLPAQENDLAKGFAKRLTPPLAEGSTASPGAKARDQKNINSGQTTEKQRIGGIMKPTFYYCFAFQSLSVARIIMRENHLQSLPVVDFAKRVVGTVTMRDIAAFQQKESQ